MNIVVFEDQFYNNFYPLSLSRPLWELRVGCFTQRERIEYIANINKKQNDRINIYYFTREYLVPFFKEKYPRLKINDFSFLDLRDEILFLNSVIIPDDKVFTLPKNVVLIQNDIPLAGFIDSTQLKKAEKITDVLLNSKNVNLEENHSLTRLEYIWDFVESNGRQIFNDFNMLCNHNEMDVDNNVSIIGDRKQLYLEDNVHIDPFVHIDLSAGPVVVRSGTEINSFTRIEGPCYIGRESIILGAKIRKGCSFGDCCRIGGEVEESIFQGYSNKYHDGFIGHSYIGSWVNLGAMTSNSDLKNNYSSVKVYLPERRINSALLKVGSFIGDFCTTSIGSLISTGASIGVGSMIVHSGAMTPYHIPPFVWYINNALTNNIDLSSFLKSCEIVTLRRNIEFTENYSHLLRHIYEITNENRSREIEKWRRMKR